MSMIFGQPTLLMDIRPQRLPKTNDGDWRGRPVEPHGQTTPSVAIRTDGDILGLLVLPQE